MNYFGVYHSNEPLSGMGDLACIAKGRMQLCAAESASEGRLIAIAEGRLRNRYALLNQLRLRESPSNALIVLRAYQKWGSAFVRHLEGPIAACVMDIEADRMVLSRDRMGEIPVFYCRSDAVAIAFSDHPDALLRAGMLRPIVDRAGLCELFALGPARTPGCTPYRDLRALEPGCCMIAESGQMRIERYFRIEERAHREGESDTIRHTRALLDHAIDDIAALRPGAMLSGGLDSTALTALLAAQDGRVKTFSVDYRGNETDYRPNAFRPSMDAPYVEIAAQSLHTEHLRFVLEQQELADALDAAVAARGFPGMADIDSSLWLFAGKIAPHARYVVSGECGDEVFGGYPWFRGDAPLSEDAFPWSGSLSLRSSVLRDDLQEMLDLRGYVRSAIRSAIEKCGVQGENSCRETRLKRMQLLCFQFFMANLQERARCMCASQGIHVLTPLCDDRLVQYVFNVPWAMKCMNGMEKGLFRAAVSDCVPEEIRTRRKSPYPKTCSPEYAQIIRSRTLEMLADSESPLREWIDAEAVRSIALSDLDAAATPWFGQLMAGPQMLAYLIQIDLWMRARNVEIRL